MDEEDGGMFEYVSDERGLSGQSERPTRKAGGTGDGRRRKRRDAGSMSAAPEARVERLIAQLRLTPRMNIEEVQEFLGVSRGTAVTDRRKAKERLAQEKHV